MEVKPRNVFLALLVFGILLVGIFRFGAAERAQQGPSLLRVNQQGDLYVVFNEKLFRLYADGTHADAHDLKELGVGELIGGIAFFRNGDLLLRSGDSTPDWYEQLLVQLRMRQPEQRTGTPGDRLTRCNLATLVCVPLKGFEQTFKRTFRVDIDAADNIFIADTGREALYWLDPDGYKLSEVNSGFRLPNQLVRDGDRIVVTNTNRNALTFVPLASGRFLPEKEWNHLKVNVPEAKQTGEVWPMDLIKVGSEWWVLSQRNNMMFGDVFRFSEDGHYQGQLYLPDAVDPLGLARLGDDVVVADYAGLRLLRFSADSELRGELSAPEIAIYADEVRAARERYARYQTILWAVFSVALVVGFAIAIYDGLQRKRDLPVSHAEATENEKSAYRYDSLRPEPSDPDVHWVGASKKFKRLNTLFATGLIILSLLLVLAFMQLISGVQDSPQGHAMRRVLYVLLVLLELPTLAIAIALPIAANNIGIGVLREWIMLRDVLKRVAIGRANDIGVTRDSLIIEGVLLKYRAPVLFIFDKTEWSQWVEPRLDGARTFRGADLLRWYWKHRRLLVISLSLLFALLLALALNIEAIVGATTDYVESFATGSSPKPQ